MAQDRSTYRTPLGVARGLGAAKHGVGQFIVERVTGMALIPLTFWGIWSVIEVARGGYEAAIAWIGSPVNAVLLVLTLIIGFRHMQAGLRVVIEDYATTALGRTALSLLNLLICVLFGALAVFSVLKVAFSTGAV